MKSHVNNNGDPKLTLSLGDSIGAASPFQGELAPIATPADSSPDDSQGTKSEAPQLRYYSPHPSLPSLPHDHAHPQPSTHDHDLSLNPTPDEVLGSSLCQDQVPSSNSLHGFSLPPDVGSSQSLRSGLNPFNPAPDQDQASDSTSAPCLSPVEAHNLDLQTSASNLLLTSSLCGASIPALDSKPENAIEPIEWPLASTQCNHQNINLSSVASKSPHVAEPAGGWSSSQINRASLEEVDTETQALTQKQAKLIGVAQSKAERFPHRFFDSNYLPQASLITLSDWPYASKFVHCCIPNNFNRNGTCRLHKYCPYCNYLKQREALLKFVPSFHRGTWHFVTLSFKGNLGFEGAEAWLSADCWNACGKALRDLVEQKLIRGFYLVEEIKILSFLPLRVIPHVHAIVDADGVDAEAVEAIEASIREHRNEEGEGVPLEPDIEVDSIASESSLYHQTRYLFKTIDLVNPYRTAWLKAEQDDRKLAWQLNSQVREFLLGMTEIAKMRPRMAAKGNLHSNHPATLAILKAEREDYRDYLKNLVAECPAWSEADDQPSE